jgi:hypothetical protein
MAEHGEFLFQVEVLILHSGRYRYGDGAREPDFSEKDVALFLLLARNK